MVTGGGEEVVEVVGGDVDVVEGGALEVVDVVGTVVAGVSVR